tara:strand:- start:3226 stop:4713 length:1488 start_codon:yes stop_codon:yes gene_type:complete
MAGGEDQGPIRINKHVLKKAAICSTMGWKTARQGKETADVELATLFKQGNDVEEAAIDEIGGGRRMPSRLQMAANHTAAAIADNSTERILQPVFNVNGTYIRPDTIDGSCREMSEIKSSKQIKQDHILDAAISTLAVEHSGHTLQQINLMHLNPNYLIGNGEPLMVSQDVTGQVRAIAEGYDLVAEIEAIRSPTMPTPSLSKNCRTCPFASDCFGQPESLVVNIPRLNNAKLQQMMDANVYTIDDLAGNEELMSLLTTKQCECVDNYLNQEEEGVANVTVDVGQLGQYDWLNSQIFYHLDFETRTTAVPIRTGEAPWAQSLTQFSVTRDDGETLSETGFLSDGSDDREQLACALISALDGDAPIVVYHESFEKGRIQELADALPHYAEQLMAISDRIVDLLPVVRNSISGADRHSLKVIAPIADPAFTYADLQIQNGGIANAVMTLLTLDGGDKILESTTGMDVDTARSALLAYCARDTLGTVLITRYLKGFLSP